MAPDKITPMLGVLHTERRWSGFPFSKNAIRRRPVMATVLPHPYLISHATGFLMPTYLYDKKAHRLHNELVKPKGPAFQAPSAFTVETGTGDSIAIPMEWLPDRGLVTVTTPDCKIDSPFSFVVAIRTTKAPPSKAKVAVDVAKKVAKGVRKGNPIGGAIEGMLVSDEIGDATLYSAIKRGKTVGGVEVTYFIKN